MILEACVSSKQGLTLASKLKIPRIELCQNLQLDGLTPSSELQKIAKNTFRGENFVMIRPHANGFYYNKKDVLKMIKSIHLAKKNNAKGVVFGALKNNSIDFEVNEEILKISKNLGLLCTFHKAIDICFDIEKSTMQLSDMGFDWLLSSGGKKNAEQGIENLKSMVNLKNRKIKILAGGGISSKNCKKFSSIGVEGIHFSIDKKMDLGFNKFQKIINNL
jgi:copper homeostasis protein